MPIFLIMSVILAVSCLIITYRTLTSYSSFPKWAKRSIFSALFISWFAPIILILIKSFNLLNGMLYGIIAKIAYFMFGVSFILILLIIVREVFWFAAYYISRNPKINPDNATLLNKVNLVTFIMALLISFYGVYEANKNPDVINLTIEDTKIKNDTKFVVASDFHIDDSTPLWRVKQLVNHINAQNPDYILLVGDIVDDKPEKLKTQMEELKKLKAKKVYLSFGNHEHYNHVAKWMLQFTNMGFDVLYNTGELIEGSNIFIGGVPDMYSADVNYQKLMFYARDNQYKVLMSHSPLLAKQIEKDKFNLIVSGHTHGGQIFPFHFISKSANDFLAGMYEVNGNKLYVSRGAGHWGPSMRIFAPSDIMVFNFKGQNNG